RLVPPELFRRLGFISGVLLGIYVAAKSIDTLIWLNFTSPSVGFAPWQYYSYKPFGLPILFAEIVVFGLLPAFLLTYRRSAQRRGLLLSAAALACAGVLLNRFVLTVQTLALPTLAFDEFLHYTPSWQEVASFGGVLGYGVIVYSLSYRYLPCLHSQKEKPHMFPGVDGFRWTLGHILFLSLFFAVALTILVTVVSAVWRTVRDFRTNRAIELCWKSDFAQLPETERRCRHELAGRVMSRTCDNAFDCRQCSNYSQFAVQSARGIVHDLGINYSKDRFYHRGHTWVKPEEDGTLTIGPDELAERLIGSPDSITMPMMGSEIEINGTAWQM